MNPARVPPTDLHLGAFPKPLGASVSVRRTLPADL